MPAEISLGHQLSMVSRAFRRFFSGWAERLDLPGNCAPALVALYRRPGLSQDQLTFSLAIDKSATARICKYLASRALIRREVNPDDRREYRLFLEPPGEALVPGIFAGYQAWNERLARDLTPEELATLQSLLSKITVSDGAPQFLPDSCDN